MKAKAQIKRQALSHLVVLTFDGSKTRKMKGNQLADTTTTALTFPTTVCVF
ncbi:hypothetical protein [Sphingobacterium sp. MYb388]|uniref:hypothetical protein n=1 Tax=Sphingobacterium sp. MYb388 TaxID=2745437 RepID=UPI0030B66540